MADQGKTVSRHRISRLMKEANIACKIRKKLKATTDSNHNKPVAANVLGRNFHRDQIDQAYAGDITYISTKEGWLYLSVFIDLCSRAIVGWSMSARMTKKLGTDSLKMALSQRKPEAGLLIHSDRGSQYASDFYQELLHDKGFVCSMSRKGNCWDNAVAESFFHTLKVELVHHKEFSTRQEAQKTIFEYIEVYYNRRRKHSANDYMAPFTYEQNLAKNA